MPHSRSLEDRIEAIVADIERFRSDVDRLRELVDVAADAGQVEARVLFEVDNASALLRAEIAAFEQLLAEIVQVRPQEGGSLSAEGATLRLLLLETTELGRRLHQLRLQQGDAIDRVAASLS